MAAIQVKQVTMTATEEGTAYAVKSEWLVGSAADTADIQGAAPGSVAYTADLSYMAMYDGTEWVQIGGGD